MTDATDPLALARRVAALAKERRASDAVLLDVRALVDYTDFFLLVSGMSARQNLAIAEHIVKTLKGEKRYALSKSGLDSGSWVCLDLGSVVVHVFDPETRARYDLELLWADAPRIDVEGTAPAPAVAASVPVAAEGASPKPRRRAVRAAAVPDADSENAPDSERPPEADLEPVEAPRPPKRAPKAVTPPPKKSPIPVSKKAAPKRAPSKPAARKPSGPKKPKR